MAFKTITTDLLIIGGGTAGCYGAKVATSKSGLSVVIAEKSFIKRSGCLAAGVNALNAYIGPGETPESHTDYVSREFDGIIREDLVYSIAKRLNESTEYLESIGLPILKNENGTYAMRGKRSVKINGENIKPLMAKEVENDNHISVLERMYIYELIQSNDRIVGALGFDLGTGQFYRIMATATLVTTGGAAGLYKPNNPGEQGHKMWYSPFNVGTGYALGMKAGAEMTTFEMRFIALRIKNTIAPTGTIAQSLKTLHINRYGDDYLKGISKPTTIDRLRLTVKEEKEGRGPCYLKTEGIDGQVELDLYKAYLNMAPSQTMTWLASGKKPSAFNVPIEGTEPYIVGGHGAAGYWVDTSRRTTITGLYAAGDVSGGSPKKYVTGCMAEAAIAVETIIDDITKSVIDPVDGIKVNTPVIPKHLGEVEKHMDLIDLESQLQALMDQYAGGISTYYVYSMNGLKQAREGLEEILSIIDKTVVSKPKDLMALYDIRDRAMVGLTVIAHLGERKETRWPCYQSNEAYPNKDEGFECYINSIYLDGHVHLLRRPLVEKEVFYEH